jgi:hypothetical protein
MWMRRAAKATQALVWGWLLFCSDALGAPSPARVESVTAQQNFDDRAGYRVPPECPDRARWHATLQARLPKGSAAEHVSQRLSIEIRREGAAQYIGTIDAAADAKAREVRGASCAEVLEALGLIAALGAEPSPVGAPEDTGGATAASGWELSPGAALALTEEDQSQPAPAPAPSAQPRFGLGAFALLETAAAPGLSANYGLGASMEWRAGTLEPLVFAGIYWGVAERVPVPGSSALARFERWSTYFVGCPTRFALHSAVAVRPCLDLDVGQLTGEGLDVGRARRSHAPLVSSGLELRLDWKPWPSLQLSGMFGGVVSLARPRFYFRPQQTSFEVAPFGLRAGALASVLF